MLKVHRETKIDRHRVYAHTCRESKQKPKQAAAPYEIKGPHQASSETPSPPTLGTKVYNVGDNRKEKLICYERVYWSYSPPEVDITPYNGESNGKQNGK